MTGSHQAHRLSRVSTTEDASNAATAVTASSPEDSRSRNGKTVEIPSSKVATMSAGAILAEYLPDLPQSSKYDLLNKLRTAEALMTSSTTRRQLLAIRILALTNLAYVYPEIIFQTKVLQQDLEEPKRLQLAYQLAELVHSGGNGDSKTPQHIQTLALGALEALTKHKSKVADVCSALNVNVNHGVLLYVTRKAVADMAAEVEGVDSFESHEWREALFSLLSSLPISSPRTADTLVSAGLIQIFVDVLNLRSPSAERVYPKVMQYLDNFVHQVRDAFQTLANAKGLDAIADLTNFEVQSAAECVAQGGGLPAEYKTQMTDYDVPFFQQQSLRSLLKFVNHMMQHGGGNFDRLLRNLIDSPQLLSALRKVLENAPMFGSNVWSGVVNIMSSFIHNEPTSYNVISEAGLSKAFLETVMMSPLEAPETLKSPTVPPAPPVEDEENSMDTDPTGDDDAGPADPMEELVQNGNSEEPRHREYKVIRSRNAELAKGILPATEAIAAIPQAFGAICLNAAGLQLFRSSNALESFFEIFESPVHVKVMKNDVNLLRILGSSFDEFVRHHPALKSAVMSSILVMVTRVGYKLRSRAWEKGVGTRLWVEGENGQLEISGGTRALYGGLGPATSDEHAEIMDSSKAALLETLLLPSGDKLVGGSDEDIPPLINSKGIGKDEDSSGLAAQNYLSAVVKFLGGFFENQGLCSAFIDAGGVEYILDFATLPSLSFDFGETEAMSELALVIHMMSEMKHHLVLPSLVSRTLDAVRCLAPFYQSNTGHAFFEGLTTRDASANSENESFSKTFSGTYYAKNLVVVHTLTRILHEVYQPHVYHSRPSQATYPFSQVNLGDMYSELVLAFGKLQAACVKNEILLQNSLSDPWKEATRIKGFGMGNSEADQVFGIVHQDENVDPGEKVDSEEMPALIDPANLPNGDSSRATVGEEHKAAFMNVQTLRYLLSTLPSNITSFFHALGKGLMPKRRIDSFQRQSASVVADALADALIDQLKVSKDEFNNSLVDQYAYWIVNLASVSQLMIEKLVERPTQPQCVTMPLLAFQRKHGLKVLEEIAGLFHQEVNSSSDSTNDPTADRRLASAYGGLKIILSFFSQITTSRTIIEAPQTVAMSSNSDRDRDKDKPDYFLPAQFLVELRMAVVPVARRMWHVQAEMVAKAPSSIAKCLVEILKSILDADGEKGAFKRNDNLPQVSATEKAVFKMNRERVGQLVERGGFEKSLAKEALFRCNNLLTAAEEYCKSFKPGSRVPHCPIPTTEIDKSPSRSLNTPRTQEPADAVVPSSSAAAAPNDDTTIMTPALEAIMRGPLNSLFEPGELPGDESTGAAESATPAQIQLPDDNEPADPAVASTMSLGNILNGVDVSTLDLQPQGLNAMDATPSVTPNGSRTLPSLRQRQAVRVEDLDTERQVIRDDLIDRCLDVLNVHHDVTFELADLIAAAVRSSKGDDWRIDTGNTLIYSLTSLQGVEDNFQPIGKKIAAYASLAALVLQDQKLYEHIKATLIDTFPAMLGFIKVFPAGPDTVPEDHSPWIGQILLIVEKLLSDDAEPVKINWDPPPPDAPRSEEPIARLEKEEVIPLDQKIELFDALVEVLPRIGKDASLALSVTRVLVMLTRNRKIATRLGEKRNLQRLFVMIKQLANTTNERLQSSFMLILRHIVEDEDTIRQIMRSEIFSAFNVRPGRHINTTEYLRQLYHVALRAPEIFVDVTNEKLKIPVYETIQRPQNLTLRTSKPEETTTQEDANGSTDPSKPSEDQIPTETTTSVEEGEKQPLEKSKTSEMKAPIVEHPDGVIHYLLSELLSYKDVEDKDTPKPTTAPATSGSSESQSDVEMTNSEGPTGVNAVDLATAVTPKKSDKVEKPEFKGEEHPIYIYRCFILQCLTELLSSYNRTKVEFINFSRKADPLAMTPSKPRSGVLNYLLNSLIPVGTLEHEDSIAFKKRSNTSSWAMRVIVALCSKSGEVVEENRPRGIDEESEADLLFVRKFVLGHALSAYKEASASTESLDVKYARMMCIADLFDRMLTSNTSADNSYLPTSQRLLAKIMFEKNFITALTSSIADIDLNFPGSKRAVKYILRPLNKLTQTAVILSESSSISTTPGQTDEDDISSASSVSSMEDEREETPDLFRNSTLGMFEQHHNEESSSESSEDDEEMYDDNYDEEMEYEEEGLELDGDVGDVISEEDELDVPGGMEGLPGDVPMNIEVVVDEDEDDEDEDEEDDSDDEEDSEDDDDDDVNDIGFAGEINGDDDNASLGNGHGEEWQSEEDDEEEEGVFEDGHVEHDGSHGPDSDHLPDIPHFETLLRVMGEEGGEIDQMELEDPITGQDLEFLGDDGPDEEGKFYDIEA
jgi:E3 ubiquitin-protein ligase HUWE1